MDNNDVQTNEADIVVDVDAPTEENVEDKDDSSAKKRKLTSDVWNDFERITNADGSQNAKCNHCRKLFVAGSNSGTSHLRNHLSRCNSKKKKQAQLSI